MKNKIRYEPAVCPYCTSGCAMYLAVQGGRVVGSEPMKADPLSEGKRCIKGNNVHQFLHHRDRLTTPLIKGEAAPWEDALGLIADTFRNAPPGAFGVLASGKTSNEEGYLLQKFARVVMGTNNIDYCARFCHSSTVAGLGPAVGSGVMETSQLDVGKADCVILAGVNVQENFPGIARRLRRARKRGATIIAIDPRVTMTVKSIADIHLQLAVGTDAALLGAMIRIILDQGLQNARFIADRTLGFGELAASAADADLQQVQALTTVPLDRIRDAAVAYARAETGCILYDEGITQHVTGSDNVRMLANLALLTGHIGRPGSGVNPMRGQISGEGSGDMGCVNVFYPGFRKVGPGVADDFARLWAVGQLPSSPGKTYMDIINTCSVVYVVGTNPMVSAPDSDNVRKALEASDLLVVQDIFMTETARLADVVLPAAVWVERTGTHTGLDRRVEKTTGIINPPGEARPDWWIIAQLAERLGWGETFKYGTAEDIFEEIRRCVPQYAGITYERLERSSRGIHWPCPTEDHPGTPTMFAETFNTPDGKGHFQFAAYKPPAETPDQQYPYILTTGRVGFHYHTGTMTRRTDKLLGEVRGAFLQIHPADAGRLGVKNRERVRVTSRRGSVELPSRLSEDIREGTVFMPFHFELAKANRLTNPASDPSCKMPEFKVCAVSIEKIEQ